MAIDLSSVDSAVLAPQASIGGMEPKDHFIELYEEDASLIDSVRTFFSIGIGKGAAATVIAEPDHREAFEAALSNSIDLHAAREQGLFMSLDAEETLSQFMEDGLPNPVKFDRVLGDILERASGEGRHVRLFGEIAVLLWAQGNVDGALALEDLANELSRKHNFRLFCAYPTSVFDGENLSPLTAVCARHSHVIAARVKAD